MASQTRVGDLRNEIHAIFRRQNFKNISDFEYDALRPSLQFASLFLTTPELAGFPHAILVAPYKHVPHPDNEELDEWAFQEKGSKLSTRDMAYSTQEVRISLEIMISKSAEAVLR